ncbi:MAG TPA: PhoH family protein, partial [Psychromonas sp.]
MTTKLTTVYLDLVPADSKRLAILCGAFDDNIKQVERRLGLEIVYKNEHFQIIGEHRYAQAGADLLKELY